MSDVMQFFGQGGFDPNSVDPQPDFEVLPPGKYIVQIDKAEVTVTKANDGHFIYLDMIIVDGQYKGQHVFDRLNISNPSQQAVDIAMRTVSALCLAVGLPSLGDTDQLLGGYCVAHVKVKDGQNNVRTYSAVPQAASPTVGGEVSGPTPAAATLPMQQQVGQAQTAQVAPGVAGKPPWQR